MVSRRRRSSAPSRLLLRLAVVVVVSALSPSAPGKSDAFSLLPPLSTLVRPLPRPLIPAVDPRGWSGRRSGLVLMAGFPPPMGGPGPDRRPGPPPMGGPGGMRGPGPEGRRSMGGPGRGAADGSGGGSGGRGPPGPARGADRYGGVPDAGDTAGQRGGSSDIGRPRGGLGAIASGVRTPADKYGDGPPRRGGEYGYGPPGPGPYGDDGPGRFGDRGGPSGGEPRGYDDRADLRGGAVGGDLRGGGGPGYGGSSSSSPSGRPQNLRYEERDYGTYVTNLRSSAAGGAGGGGRGGGAVPPPSDVRDLEEEVERLRKENALLKRSCRDLLNNLNELSNRLFGVDEGLKEVAKAFPDEDEVESLEWLLRR